MSDQRTDEATAGSTSATRTGFPAGVKIVLVALVLVAAGGIYAVARSAGSGSSGIDNPAIERLIPSQGEKIFQQNPIGIDLASGYDAELALNGVPIPDDELNRTPQIELIEFQPGEGKAVERYQSGQNCVLATYWRLETGRQQTSSISWCFTVI